MASQEMWDAPDIVPSITYADIPRAIEWLERVFGFRGARTGAADVAGRWYDLDGGRKQPLPYIHSG